MPSLLRPRALRTGDLVQVVAPSGPFDRGRLDRGVAVLEARGYRVRFREDLFAVHRYLAGDDARRLAELQAAFDDPEVAAVWAARGGYGAMRLLPHLDLAALRARPKAFVGFSDLTALHAALNGAGLVTFHGPVAVRLGEEPPEALDALWRSVEGVEPPGPIFFEPFTALTPGRVRGPLVGGNLSVLTRLLGTPWLPPLDGAVLFLEDVGERPYRLDRMLTHLELAGVPGRVAGVLVGQLTGCDEPDGAYTGAQIVAERLAAWGVPAALGFPAGHGDENFTLPFGLPVTLDAGAGRLDWDEAPVTA